MNSVDFLLTNKDITYEIRTEIKRLGRPIPDLIISKTDVGKSRNYSRNFNSTVYDRFNNGWQPKCMGSRRATAIYEVTTKNPKIPEKIDFSELYCLTGVSYSYVAMGTFIDRLIQGRKNNGERQDFVRRLHYSHNNVTTGLRVIRREDPNGKSIYPLSISSSMKSSVINGQFAHSVRCLNLKQDKHGKDYYRIIGSVPIWLKPLLHMYEVCKLNNEAGNVAPDLATLRRRDLHLQYMFELIGVEPVNGEDGLTETDRPNGKYIPRPIYYTGLGRQLEKSDAVEEIPFLVKAARTPEDVNRKEKLRNNAADRSIGALLQIRTVSDFFMPEYETGISARILLCHFTAKYAKLKTFMIIQCGDKTRTQKQVCEIFNTKYPDRRISQSTWILTSRAIRRTKLLDSYQLIKLMRTFMYLIN
ncbi:hypothetical protein NQ318_010333 [Aromia moschata]|uniref:Uncharacterized protein n=1 Tax=Aromia moschata TaxID=1265417 RepID=A0AAV8YFK9_9CUCU|nr:hypothetical protein NQ318_010333 [Aromia moschata]